ncbi:transposase [Microbacterium sp. C7(2022)]|uniref:transposase n=1 Tax=Microbacterium sp. C7(2022) TaxID=2992759 RepID=UPI00237A7E4B|nr:transposase [Microbacterium sp. C7(2022)]MDE0545240.1 transposase [Microbacterium sp. C7(2022)]
MAGDDDLDAVAAELYALPPAEFTAARNARAQREAPPLARAIRALRKPTVAAFAVNLLTRDGQLSEAVELSAALREAQDDLDAAELSRLAPQRRALVAALADSAAGLATAQGVSVSSAAHESIRATINAAVMDAASAAAVLTARLVTGLDAGGEVPADAVGGTLPGAAPAPPATRDDLAARRARKAAERAARESERAANEAERIEQRLDEQRAKVQERVDHLNERVDDLRRDLERVQSDAAAAASDLSSLESDLRQARATAARARAAAERARTSLDAD